MFIRKSESIESQNPSECTVNVYPFNSPNLSFATAFIDGRYPAEKRVTNTECEEIYYVLSGSGIIHSTTGDFKINIGDAYLFEKAEIYWVEGNKLSLVLVNYPKWTPEQHKVVD